MLTFLEYASLLLWCISGFLYSSWNHDVGFCVLLLGALGYGTVLRWRNIKLMDRYCEARIELIRAGRGSWVYEHPLIEEE